MTRDLRETLDDYVREGGEEQLINAFAAVAAAEAQFAQLRHEPNEWLHAGHVKELLEGDDEASRSGLQLLDRRYRHRVCGELRHRHPDLSRDDLVKIWQRVLLAILREAKRGGVEADSVSAEAAWTIADRCAQRIQRRRHGWSTRLEQALRTTDLGRMWQMLTDLQQDEVLSLISGAVKQFDQMQKSVWQRYARFLVDGPPGALAALAANDAHADSEANSEQPVEETLRTGREQVSAYLNEHGYDLLGDEVGQATDAQPTPIDGQSLPSHFALDRLVAESLEAERALTPPGPIDIGGADRHLTVADREALDASAPELPEMILLQHRAFARPESTLSSRPHSSGETRLRATTAGYEPGDPDCGELEVTRNYEEIIRTKRLDWAPHYDFVSLLGEGGQGAVYLVRCPGSDGYENRLALKIFDPRHFAGHYVEGSRTMARMARLVSSIHHPHVLDVIDFRQQQGVRVMLMEWINGYDLGRLMVPAMLERIEREAGIDREYLTDVVVRQGPDHPRLRPGVAVAILRHCLAALDELHRRGIVHGDIKPWNIMLTNNGFAKLIDIGSAFPWRERRTPSHWTPWYLAPEVMENQPYTPRSDLASLGYVLIELMSGRSLFAQSDTHAKLLEAKKALPDRLAGNEDSVLPDGVQRDPRLTALCRRLIDPDPERRFLCASDADLNSDCGAYKYLESLASDKMSVAWEVDIRRWLACLK